MFDRTCDAVAAGKLQQHSTVVVLDLVAEGRTSVVASLQKLQALWKSQFADHNAASLCALLQCTYAGAMQSLERAHTTEVVWTGPRVEGSFLRGTRQIVQDIVRSARHELLVVGYWIAGTDESESVINSIIEQISDAVDRGVTVSVVLDRGNKPYGKNNRDTLIELWPSGSALPTILTWHVPTANAHSKLHAKVLVADRKDALVTSANLTRSALDINMEMGVRVSGAPSEQIAAHFDLLVQSGIIRSFEECQS